MADVETLKGLLERVRAATGPDERLDQMLFAHFYGWSYPLHGAASDEYQRMRPEASCTESVDAALALIAEELPGWRWVAHSPRSGLQFGASLSDPARGGRIVTGSSDASAPLALCAALLTALIARTETDGGRDA